MRHTLIEWGAKEYEHKERSSDWYWAVGIITLSIAVVSVMYRNTLFAILVILSAFSLTLYSKRKPATLKITVNDGGIIVDKTFYPYSQLDSFNVERIPHTFKARLVIKSKKLFMPLILIPVENIDPDSVDEEISKFLKKEDLHEPLSHKIMDYLGF